jgi:hypothetical protein
MTTLAVLSSSGMGGALKSHVTVRKDRAGTGHRLLLILLEEDRQERRSIARARRPHRRRRRRLGAMSLGHWLRKRCHNVRRRDADI